MLKRIVVTILFCMVLLSSIVSAAAVGEFEGEDGKFIGSTIYKLGFNNFEEEKLNYLRGVNMGGKCAYYEGPSAPCTPEGGSFLLPGGDDLYSWYYYDEIGAAMIPYNEALAQLRLERKERARVCDESTGWRGDTWYDAQDCFDEVKNDYDYGKIYDKEAEQYKVRKSFFKKLNEEIVKRYLTGEREEGALQSLQTAFSGYNSCMDTCDEPFGASKKSSSHCDDICIEKYQETLMKDFARHRKAELALLESQTTSETNPLSGNLPGSQLPDQGEQTPFQSDQDNRLPDINDEGNDIKALNDGTPTKPDSKGGSKLGAIFVASMFLATGILMWYLIFKYVIRKIWKKRK